MGKEGLILQRISKIFTLGQFCELVLDCTLFKVQVKKRRYLDVLDGGRHIVYLYLTTCLNKECFSNINMIKMWVLFFRYKYYSIYITKSLFRYFTCIERKLLILNLIYFFSFHHGIINNNFVYNLSPPF